MRSRIKIVFAGVCQPDGATQTIQQTDILQVMILRALGKLPSAVRLAELAKSPNWKNGSFANIEPTEVLRKGASYPKMLRDMFSRPKSTSPSVALPSARADLMNLADSTPQIVWFGHSSYLISHNGFRILVDPVLFGTSAPVSFIGKPFPVTSPYAPDDMPNIDLLVISHDHYDHLDVVTLTKFRERIRRVVCPLGVSAHLTYWGFDPAIITEVDWHDRVNIADDIAITALPARHFSGRVFTRGKSLWASYALQLRQYKLFLGGDSGYDQQFKWIGANHGPFDFAFLECGQYGKDWPLIHMFPEETALAAVDLKTKQMLPVHWAKFVLANHTWFDPIDRLVVAAKDADFELITPNIGSVVELGSVPVINHWWSTIR